MNSESPRDEIKLIDLTHFEQLNKTLEEVPLGETAFMEALVGQGETRDLSNGAQAKVEIFNSKETGEPYIVKRIYGVTAQEGSALIKDTHTYRELLEQNGIDVPKLYIAGSLQAEKAEDSSTLVFVEDLVGMGKNLKDDFQDPQIPLEIKTDKLMRIANTIVNLPKLKEPHLRHRTSIAGDFRPVNFIEDGDHLVLVDTFVPKLLQEDNQVGPYIYTREAPLTQQAMTFLTGDQRGQLGALFYFALRHVRNDQDTAQSFKDEMRKFSEDLEDKKVQEFLIAELTTNFSAMSEVYKTADIAHLPKEIVDESMPKKLAALPNPAMHNPTEVSAFVERYLAEKNESPRNIGLQIIGVKTLQNPELIDRFLNDFSDAVAQSTYKGEIKLFVVDDSWDNTAQKRIEEIAQKHKVEYFAVRKEEGFAHNFLERYRQKIENDTKLTPSQKKHAFWLARAMLRDQMQAPLVGTSEEYRFQDPMGELGGIAGTQNFGYLVAAYEAGRAGANLNETSITINEDDQRYKTLSKGEDGKIETTVPDLFAERAAWLKDPKTEAVIGRYTGHTGNPISLVKDTLEIGVDILRSYEAGTQKTYQIFDGNSGTFSTVSTADAYAMLPDIFDAAAKRQAIAGLWTKDKHYKNPVNWDEASKLDLGNITLTGETMKHTPTPLGGVFDYNFSGLLRAGALTSEDPNRSIRREEPLMHHRTARALGGDAFGTEMLAAFNNKYAQEQLKLAHVISSDPDIRRDLISMLGIPEGDEETLDNAIRTFEANGSKIEEILQLREELKTLATNQQKNEVTTRTKAYLEKFLTQFSENAIQEVAQKIHEPITSAETMRGRKAIRRYMDIYKAWPDMVETAYELGKEERYGSLQPIEIGYLPGVSAHTGRPLEIGVALAKTGLQVALKGGKSGRHIVNMDTVEQQHIRHVESDLYYFHPGELIRDEFTVDQMTNNILAITKDLEEQEPPIVLVDHNVPLLMAAKLVGIPTVTITNMSNVGFTSREFVQTLGPEAQRLSDKYYAKLEPKLQEVFVKTYRARHGEDPEQIPNWFQLMEVGDLTLVADNQAFVGINESDSNVDLNDRLNELAAGNVAYIGSIQPETMIGQNINPQETARIVDLMETARNSGRKIIFGSFGSINKPELYENIIKIAGRHPELVVVSTITDTQLQETLPENFVPMRFADLQEITPYADVLMCQGGSGTLYPYIKKGNAGILTITTNADQQYNAMLAEKHGIGRNLPISMLDEKNLESELLGLLQNQQAYAQKLHDLAPETHLDGAEIAAKIIKEKFKL